MLRPKGPKRETPPRRNSTSGEGSLKGRQEPRHVSQFGSSLATVTGWQGCRKAGTKQTSKTKSEMGSLWVEEPPGLCLTLSASAS